MAEPFQSTPALPAGLLKGMPATVESILLDLVLGGVVSPEDVFHLLDATAAVPDLPLPVTEALQQHPAAKQHVAGTSIDPAAFRACILDTVREDAEDLFAGIGPSSEAATPRASQTASMPPGGFAESPRAQSNVHAAKGSLNDSDFPSLDITSLPGKGKHGKLPSEVLMRVTTQTLNPKPNSSGRRIAPTAVTAVDRNTAFLAVAETSATASAGATTGFRDALLRRSASPQPPQPTGSQQPAWTQTLDCSPAQSATATSGAWGRGGGGASSGNPRNPWASNRLGLGTLPASPESSQGSAAVEPPADSSAAPKVQTTQSTLKPPRSQAPSPLPAAATGEGRMSHRGRHSSPGPTPQSRFRPTPADSPAASCGSAASVTGPRGSGAAVTPQSAMSHRHQSAAASPQPSVYFSAPEAPSPLLSGSRASSQSPGEVSQRMEVSSTNQNAETPGVNASESNPAAAVDPARACEGANGPAEAHKPLETTVPDLGVPWRLDPGVQILARLHARLLCNSATLVLCSELGLLLHLLALPEGLAPASASARVLPTAEAAAAYSCRVLEQCGCLVKALRPPLLETLAAARTVQRHSPALAELAGSAAESSAGRPRPHSNSARLPASLMLLGFTSDGLPKRTPEEQRRVTNREMCRDELLGLLREAAALGQAFGGSQPANGASDQLRGSANSGTEEAVFALLQHRAPALLRKVAPDNLAHLAELFTSAVLQAAATGEAVLDEELGSLAKQDLSRFHRLNQRLQAPEPRQARRQGSPKRVSSATRGPLRPGAARGQGPRQGLPDGCQGSRDLAAELPPALRLYLLFLEAADSYRLNTHLTRCMAVKLKQLTGDASDSRAASFALQHTLAAGALASFLSYLCFAAGGSGGQSDGFGEGLQPHVDISGALDRAEDFTTLLQTVHWATCLLRFLPPAQIWRANPVGSPLARGIARLAALRHHTRLIPAAAGFGAGHLGLRGMLDAILERLQYPEDMGLGVGSRNARLESLLTKNAASVDPRIMQLCCPLLEQATAALQGLGGRRQLRPARVQKIRPSLPAAAKPAAPEALRLAAEGQLQPDQQRLRAAFLDMYSSPEQKVKLRELVIYVGEAVGNAAAEASMQKVLEAAAAGVTSRLQAAADAAAGDPAANSESVNALLQAAAEKLAAENTYEAMEDSLAAAEPLMRQRASTAVAALSQHGWTPAVTGTGAALAAETATSICANQLIQEVPGRLRALLMAAASAAAREAVKVGRQRTAELSESNAVRSQNL